MMHRIQRLNKSHQFSPFVFAWAIRPPANTPENTERAVRQCPPIVPIKFLIASSWYVPTVRPASIRPLSAIRIA
ncbi:hypothetical protein AB6F62_16670 [Providencia huaxiensis]|uniref:hypothetical protein n=1 Tax=Providencia huaxiensis TaxID=2027290 RepID=UPI0034DD356B